MHHSVFSSGALSNTSTADDKRLNTFNITFQHTTRTSYSFNLISSVSLNEINTHGQIRFINTDPVALCQDGKKWKKVKSSYHYPAVGHRFPTFHQPLAYIHSALCNMLKLKTQDTSKVWFQLFVSLSFIMIFSDNATC